MRIDEIKRLKKLEKENIWLKRLARDLSLDNAISQAGIPEKLLSPSKRRKVVGKVCIAVWSPRHGTCRILGQKEHSA